MAEKRTGRKLQLNNTTIKNADNLLRKGHYVKTICQKIGISQVAWYEWLNRGEEYQYMDEEAYNDKSQQEQDEIDLLVKFAKTIKEASADAEIEAVDMLKEHGRDKWQALAWFLERRYQDRWSEKTTQTLEHTGQDGQPIQSEQKIDFSNLTDEELDNLDKLINKSTQDNQD